MTKLHTALGEDYYDEVSAQTAITSAHSKECKGFGYGFFHPTEAIARILRKEDEGLATLNMVLHGSLAKVVHYDPNCQTCTRLAGKQMDVRMRR